MQAAEAVASHGVGMVAAAAAATATEEQTTFHLQCRLCLHSMLMGNRLPMVLSDTLAVPPGGIGSNNSNNIVDAHNVQGIDMPRAVQGVSQAMHIAMDSEELLLRRLIGHKVILSMGRMMTHFEGDVDPHTGILHVDHVFKPHIMGKVCCSSAARPRIRF